MPVCSRTLLFNSLGFFAFAAVFFALWPLVCRRATSRYVAITVASLVFYGAWDPRFVFLLLGTALSDFVFGIGMTRSPRHKKLLLGASLCVNLGALFAFKYSTFAARTLDATTAALGHPTHAADGVPAFVAILPPGISFYTFQSMSYTIDVYRGTLKPTKNPLHFLAFISMFPQLVAGPIVRAKDLLPRLEMHSAPSPEARFSAVSLMVLGYWKKVVIADNLARAVTSVYEGPGGASGLLYWFATLLFAAQIYADFSGYSDIARGLARLMGYEFPLNFDHPYTARSMREFWQRWHITLSTWFRDYVYLPLGGNRKSATRNLWITMLLSGLWHGASFTFVAWGAWHAMLLTVERWTRWPERAQKSQLARALAGPFMFVLTLIGWVFFRARTMQSALSILSSMLGLSASHALPYDLSQFRAPVFYLFLGIVTEIITARRDRRAADRPASAKRSMWGPVGVALLIASCIYLRGPGNAFIYFQF